MESFTDAPIIHAVRILLESRMKSQKVMCKELIVVIMGFIVHELSPSDFAAM